MFKFVNHINEKTHDDFVKQSEYCTLLQSSSWAKVKQNWNHEIVGVYENEKLVASSLVLIKSLPLGLSMMYMPRGPIMDYNNQQLVQFFFKELKKWAKKYHCLFVKFDPAIHVNDYKSYEYNTSKYAYTQTFIDIFESAGTIHQGFPINIEETIQPRFQSNVYNEENWEENLPKHTKRLIRDADRRNVQIVSGGMEFIDEFSHLVEITEERKQVALRNKEYFELLMNTYQEDGIIFLAQCNLHELSKNAHARKMELENELKQTPENAKKKLRKLEDQIISNEKDLQEFDKMLEEIGNDDQMMSIAGILSVQFGDTCEMLYAGMDERFKKFMPQYKEYVANFNWAFNRGCKWANMGGVDGSLDDGLTKFKDNFNPLINEYIGEFDLPVNTFLYKASQLAYQIRKKRNLKK